MAPLSLLNTCKLPEEGPENLLCTEEEVICLLQSIHVDVLKQVARTNSGRMLKFTVASIDAAVTKLYQSTSNFYNSFVPCIYYS